MLKRRRATPVPSALLIAGQAISTVVVVAIMATILLVIGKLLYGVGIGPRRDRRDRLHDARRNARVRVHRLRGRGHDRLPGRRPADRAGDDDAAVASLRRADPGRQPLEHDALGRLAVPRRAPGGRPATARRSMPRSAARSRSATCSCSPPGALPPPPSRRGASTGCRAPRRREQPSVSGARDTAAWTHPAGERIRAWAHGGRSGTVGLNGPRPRPRRAGARTRRSPSRPRSESRWRRPSPYHLGPGQLVEAAHALDDTAAVLGVVGAGVEDRPVADDVVADDQRAGPREPQRPVEVVRIVLLVGVDEDQVERAHALRMQLGQRLQRRTDPQLDQLS